ncbi:C1D-domain-containing protein [Coprinopsis marcescibilis]|uniref:Exosome complex protein n=1 Tax=Coprinopsis marcescibilis TaxID=230819 RepID=A0A5C3L236_COPMA|nr:C1D-domain-containing protein [Coprinopsis marcescibilis]
MSSSDTAKIRARLSNLSSSLDELESLIDPLFSQTLPETIVNLEPLQQAKLQTVLPYAVYDLVFMYLKLQGVDPKTHPVIPELDRIRQYFEKISNTENPPQRKTEVDKEAAGRFIKNAIAQVKWTKTAAEKLQDESPAESSSKVPVKVTDKMLERQKYEEELKKQDADNDGEEESLEVFDESAGGDASGMDVDAQPEPARKKRQRPSIDPFSGYPGPSNESGTVAEVAQGKAPKDAAKSPEKTKKNTSSTTKKKKRKSTSG